jgi:hypothetical protein
MAQPHTHTQGTTGDKKKRRAFVRIDAFDAAIAPSEPDIPRFHPHSSQYEQEFDLRHACNTLHNTYDRTNDPRVQIKNFPLYMIATFRRVVRRAQVPRGAAAVAIITRGLNTLDENPLAIEYQDLVEHVDDADQLEPKHQIELDAMLHKLPYTPRADHGGVGFWGYRCSLEFRSDVAYSAAQLGTTIYTISTVALALGMHDLPGVHYKCAASMTDVVSEFLDALRNSIRDVNSRFVDYLAQARKRAQRPVSRFPLSVDDDGHDAE